MNFDHRCDVHYNNASSIEDSDGNHKYVPFVTADIVSNHFKSLLDFRHYYNRNAMETR